MEMKRMGFKEALSAWQQDELITLTKKVEENKKSKRCSNPIFQEIEVLMLYVKLKFAELISSVYEGSAFHFDSINTEFDMFEFGDKLKYELAKNYEDYILFLKTIPNVEVKQIIIDEINWLFENWIDYICSYTTPEKIDNELFLYIKDIFKKITRINPNKLEIEKIMIDIINKAYRDGNPLISDKEYDKLTEGIENPSLIGVKPTTLRKQKLPIPMYSLNKNKEMEDVEKWINSKNLHNEIFVITPKYDGCSIVNNQIDFITRGDGEEGQNCNYHFKNESKGKEDCIYFGEAIMKISVFNEKYKNKEINGKIYKNARNLVAGILNTKNPDEEVLNDIKYIRYGIVTQNIYSNRTSQLEELDIQFYEKVPYIILKASEISKETIDNIYYQWSEELDYEIDGVVIEIEDCLKRKNLGRELNNNPAYARALKFGWESVEITTITGIGVEVSKQGCLKPVAYIEHRKLNGVTVKKATCYNFRWMIDNDVKVGCKVKIIRSGEVIPKIIEVVEKSNSNETYFITKCPSCNNDVVWNESKVELVCINPDCKEKRIALIFDFFKVLKFEEFGELTIKKLYDNGFDTELKILQITKEQLLNIDGFADISTDKLLNQINKIKEEGVSLYKLQSASNCFHGFAEKLLSLFPQTNEIEDNQLLEINGVSDKRIKEWRLGWERFNEFYSKISTVVKIKEEVKQIPISNKYCHLNVVFTGFRDKELEQQIINNGGVIGTGVSSKITHLVVKDKDSGSSKINKAIKLNIEILTKEGFINLIK